MPVTLLARRLAVRLALLGEAARPCQLYRPGAAPPPERLARLLTGAPHVTGAPWAQNTKNKTRAQRASIPSCGARRGQGPPTSYAPTWVSGEGSGAAIGTPPGAARTASGGDGSSPSCPATRPRCWRRRLSARSHTQSSNLLLFCFRADHHPWGA